MGFLASARLVGLCTLISRILDAQQALNYSVSATVGAVALTPINPLIGFTGQDATNQKQIAESNRVPYAFLGFDIVYDKNVNEPVFFLNRIHAFVADGPDDIIGEFFRRNILHLHLILIFGADFIANRLQ